MAGIRCISKVIKFLGYICLSKGIVYIRRDCVHGFPKLLVECGVMVRTKCYSSGLGLGTGNGYFISFFFFSYLE